MRRAVEHRALMAIAMGDVGVANASTLAMATLDRGWTLYAHTPASGTPIKDCSDEDAVARVWESLATLHGHQISHGDLRAEEITFENGTARFGGFGSAEYGATDEQLQADVAQLLVTTTALYDADGRRRRCRRGLRQGIGAVGVATTDQVRHAITNPKVG